MSRAAALCRDCLEVIDPAPRCPRCGSPRVLAHEELFDLTIAHMDCDAFFASVEKRDKPELRDRPVIIGGGRRGVVATACYIARIRGVRSAMPMFQALRLCPEAVVIRPRMAAYGEVSRRIRAMMQELTPAVEPLSLDEAFLDLSGTEKLHRAPPALSMARLLKRIEEELGLSGSVGLSHNKFLAKVASDLDKPRGFSVIGRAETEAFLKDRPVGLIWGVGRALQERLERDGIRRIGDLLRWERKDLCARHGSMGDRLWHLARGMDCRPVSATAPVRSISKETTFAADISDPEPLDGHLWRLCEQVAERAKARGLVGRVVMLKLKRADHRALSRRVTLPAPTQMAERIYASARPLLDTAIARAPFRLIGVGIGDLEDAGAPAGFGDLLDRATRRREQAERAADRIRQRFGAAAIVKGRALR